MAFGSLKKKYVYVDDAGKNWIIRYAEDKATATPSPELNEYNPASPPSGGIQGTLPPKRCRGVHAQGSVAVGSESSHMIKRFFVCNPASDMYKSNASQNISYTGDDEADGITLVSTGRKGERITF